MSERPTIIGPRAIMGGTRKQDLLDAYRAATDALDVAAWAVAITTPKLRNYQRDTNRWRMAMNLHEARLAQLKRMRADVEAIAGYVVAQRITPRCGN